MRKLNKNITRSWFKSSEDYLALQKFWAKKMQSRESIPCRLQLLYKALLGRDWTTGIAGDRDDLTSLKMNKWSLGANLHFFKDFIDETKAYELLPLIINTYNDPYRSN